MMRRARRYPDAAERTELDVLAADNGLVAQMTRKQKRLAVIAGLGAVLALATTLILFALRDQIVFFYSPTEIAEQGGRRRHADPAGRAGQGRHAGSRPARPTTSSSPTARPS